ncbi:MAG: hypothetical protein R3217_09075 [Gammaproteobacteria bacterium]|nr:hypothetical protein [Gammaproteobacteria bacterium]
MNNDIANQNHWLKLVLVVFIGLGMAACSNKTRVESDLGIEDAPDWVNEGSQALDSDDGRLIHGIGMAPKMGDFSLQKSTADDRARTEVARVLSSYMDVVSQDYLASAGLGEGSVNEQVITREIKNITNIRLVGARNIGRWTNEKNGDIWSIFELELDKVKGLVARAENMDPAFKEYFEKNGETLFDRFVEEK